MKYFKFNHILIVLFILFSGIIFWQFLSLLSFPDSNIQFEGESKQEKLYPNLPLIQKITATKNNFSQMNVSLSKFSPKFGDKIVLEILDESCQNILAKSKINTLTWNNIGYEKFSFKPILDSEGKIYCLKFIYIPFGKEQDKRAYISSHTSPDVAYTNTGNKKDSGEQKNRTLELKPAYENGSNWQNISQLMDRMSQYKPEFFKGYSLEIIFLISLIFIISFACMIIFI